MEKKTARRSWTISDELWDEVKGYIPKKEQDPNRQKNQRKSGMNRLR